MVQPLGWEDPLEKEMATHSSTFAWKIPWMEEPGRLQSMGSLESDMTERLHFLFFNYFKQFCITIVSFFKTSIVKLLEIIFK